LVADDLDWVRSRAFPRSRPRSAVAEDWVRSRRFGPVGSPRKSLAIGFDRAFRRLLWLGMIVFGRTH
jgi:hypothetical protein